MPDEIRRLDDWLRAEGLESDDDRPQSSIPDVPYDQYEPGRIWHLALVQNNISRMSNWSAKVKALSISLVIGVIAFLAHSGFPVGKNADLAAVAVSLATVAAFFLWCLDAYFLTQERLFRGLYDEIRQYNPEIEPFSMDTSKVPPSPSNNRRWLASFRSRTLLLFHGGLVTLLLLVWTYLLVATGGWQRIAAMF